MSTNQTIRQKRPYQGNPAIIIIRCTSVLILFFYGLTHLSQVASAQTCIVKPTDIVLASDGQGEDHFGSSVAISGDWAMVGAPDDDDLGSGAGAIYIYHWDGQAWGDETKLTASDGQAYDQFGFSVSIKGNQAMVGAPYKSGKGAAYLLSWTGSQWTQHKLMASDGQAGDYFGSSVSIYDDMVVVGAYGDDDLANGAGSAYIFEWNGSQWVEEKLLAGDGQNGDYYGYSVSISNNRVLIGAYGDDDAGSNAGAAYIYDWNGSSWQETKLLASDGGSHHIEFGKSVSISGDHIIVGAASPYYFNALGGAVYFYQWDGNDWNEIQKTQALDGHDNNKYGLSVSIDGDRAIVGAPSQSSPGHEPVLGAAYTYHWNGNNWIEVAKFIDNDGGTDSDNWGGSVALDPDRAIIGAKWVDQSGNNGGAAYFHAISIGDLDSDTLTNACDNCLDDYNPLQADCDQNGRGDLCDTITDTDEDLVPDDCDNCPEDHNPDQQDRDEDGIGDACDQEFNPACWPYWNDEFGDPGANGAVYALTFDGQESVYVGGGFTTINGVSANGIAVYDVTQKVWSALGSIGDIHTVNAIAVSPIDGKVYAGGQALGTHNRLAVWDGMNWTAISGITNGVINALVFAEDGTLYVGGSFVNVGGSAGDAIVTWNGVSFSSLGIGLNNTVRALAVAGDGTLYVGGEFTNAVSTADYIASWDGLQWSDLGSGMSAGGYVYSLNIAATGEVYAGGDFTTAGGVSVSRVAKWNPVTEVWSALGAGVGGSVYSLSSNASYLYAGGNLSQAGGQIAYGVARWDLQNHTWSNMDPGISGPVNALVIANDSILIGGYFSYLFDGRTANYITMWLEPFYDDDEDGWYNICDRCPQMPGEDNNDQEGDGVGDLCDNCLELYNPDQADLDEDSVGDVCDNCPDDLNPIECQPDYPECDCQSNPDQCWQPDSDGDLWGDACDICSAQPDYDGDLDALPGCFDNCPGIDNPAVPRPEGDPLFDPQCSNCEDTWPLPDCCWQVDSDGDGLGDECDHTHALSLSAMKDRAGNVLETYVDSDEDGHPDSSYKGDPGEYISSTVYDYQNGKLVSAVTTPSDGSAQPRTVDYIYDPEHPDRLVGMLTAGCGCSGGNTFTFYDDLYRLSHITTAEADQSQPTGVLLESYTYNGEDDRYAQHHVRNGLGNMVLKEARWFTDNQDQSYEAVICLPLDGQYAQVQKEGYDIQGRLVELQQYNNLMETNCQAAPSLGMADSITIYEHDVELDDADCVGEQEITIHPSGIRDVSEWCIQGTLYAPGSVRETRHYRQSASEEIIDYRKERFVYVAAYGDYRLVSSYEPSGKVVTYTYDDANDHPERLLTETHSDPDGAGPLPVLVIQYQYDGAGRVTDKIQPGPNGTDVTTHYTYDAYGRMLTTTENYNGSNPAPRTTEYVYNAFDEQVFNRDEADQVRVSIYDTKGQVTDEYSTEYSGSLDFASFSPENPPVDILQQTSYEYHSISGRIEHEKTALSDVIPFAKDSAPFAETVYTYDDTGVWQLAVVQPGLAAMSYLYDDQGRVKQTTSPEGIVNKTIYNSRGLVEQSIIADGAVDYLATTTFYDEDGRTALVMHPDGTFLSSEYDDFGRLEAQHRCDQYDCQGTYDLASTFEYDDASQVIRQYTPGISDTVTDYDDWGRVYRTRQRATFGVDDDDHGDGLSDLVTLTEFDAAGNVRRSAQKADSNPNQIVEGTDAVTRYVYNNLNQIDTATLVNNIGQGAFEEVTKYQYDAAGRQSQVIVDFGGLALTTQFQYDALGRVTKVIDPEGHYADTIYDSRGQAIRRLAYEDGDGDGQGGTVKSQERSSFDPAGRMTTMARLAAANTPAGTPANPAVDQVTGYSYDDDGRRLTTTTYNMNSATPIVATTQYDPIGRMKKTIDPLGNTTENFYEPVTGLLDYQEIHDIGDLQRIRTVDFAYDTLARVQSQTDAGESGSTPFVTTFGYDDADRVTSRTDAENMETRYTFDLLGRRSFVIEAYGTGLARATESLYDRLGRLSEMRAFDDSQVQSTTYGYDLAGRRILVRLPDEQPSGAIIDYDYDQAGRLTQKTDQRGIEVTYTYDDRGLLLSRTADGSPLTSDSFSYDGLGRMSSAVRLVESAEVSRSTMAYTDLSQLDYEDQELFNSGTTRRLDYSFDQAGNRLRLAYPAGTGVNLTYTVDTLNRVDLLNRNNQVLVDYDYSGLFADIRKVRTTASNTWVETDYAYDEHRRQEQIVNRKRINGTPTTLKEYNYTYDAAGNRLTTAGAANVTYDYDGLHRVESATYGTGVESFDMDLLGNRDEYSDTRPGGATIAYGPNNPANEYSTVGGTTVDYDLAGNLTGDERGFGYGYDFENRLVKIFDDDNGDGVQDQGEDTLWSAVYDALGRRVRVTNHESPATIHYYYDGQRVVAEYAWSGNSESLKRYFIDGPQYIDEHILLSEVLTATPTGLSDTAESYSWEFLPAPEIISIPTMLWEVEYDPIIVVRGRDYYYIHRELFSVAGLTNASANLVEQYDYDTYGDPSFFNGSGTPIAATAYGNPYLFTGQRLDRLPAAGSPLMALYHYRARAYDPRNGRFLQPDPAEYIDSMNLYEYVKSSPINYSDYNGHRKQITLDVMASDAVSQDHRNAYSQAVTAGRFLLARFGVDVTLNTTWYVVPTPVTYKGNLWYLDYVNLLSERDVVDKLPTGQGRANHRIYMNIMSALSRPNAIGFTYYDMGLQIENERVWDTGGLFTDKDYARHHIVHEILHRKQLVGNGHARAGIMRYSVRAPINRDNDNDGIFDHLELDCFTAARLVKNSDVNWEDIDEKYLIGNQKECCKRRNPDDWKDPLNR
ncbi:MAG: hypothetical protein HJJLKODD_02711 [Phycisphaerae bacterium]|nr:hypothetical protein [Phycisphaerae bacterium]